MSECIKREEKTCPNFGKLSRCALKHYRNDNISTIFIKNKENNIQCTKLF